jgi:hypothetical protein
MSGTVQPSIWQTSASVLPPILREQIRPSRSLAPSKLKSFMTPILAPQTQK